MKRDGPSVARRDLLSAAVGIPVVSSTDMPMNSRLATQDGTVDHPCSRVSENYHWYEDDDGEESEYGIGVQLAVIYRRAGYISSDTVDWLEFDILVVGFADECISAKDGSCNTPDIHLDEIRARIDTAVSHLYVPDLATYNMANAWISSEDGLEVTDLVGSPARDDRRHAEATRAKIEEQTSEPSRSDTVGKVLTAMGLTVGGGDVATLFEDDSDTDRFSYAGSHDSILAYEIPSVNVSPGIRKIGVVSARGVGFNVREDMPAITVEASVTAVDDGGWFGPDRITVSDDVTIKPSEHGLCFNADENR